MGIINWLLNSNRLNYHNLYIITGHEDWIKSGLIPYRNPEGAYYFRRRVRIFYNQKWHKGKFKLWKKWNKKDADKFFIVETKSGRRMLIPNESVYFKQYNTKYMPVQGNYYCEIYKVHMFIKGEIKEYEKAYLKRNMIK